ncbi:hypothetical protein DFH06DRAFT_1144818 [Mycena polygramma]|nr:hypothetical protein DFH06DRAFT_1144818 [Mycena polygramma]
MRTQWPQAQAQARAQIQTNIVRVRSAKTIALVERIVAIADKYRKTHVLSHSSLAKASKTTTSTAPTAHDTTTWGRTAPTLHGSCTFGRLDILADDEDGHSADCVAALARGAAPVRVSTVQLAAQTWWMTCRDTHGECQERNAVESPVEAHPQHDDAEPQVLEPVADPVEAHPQPHAAEPQALQAMIPPVVREMRAIRGTHSAQMVGLTAVYRAHSSTPPQPSTPVDSGPLASGSSLSATSASSRTTTSAPATSPRSDSSSAGAPSAPFFFVIGASASIFFDASYAHAEARRTGAKKVQVVRCFEQAIETIAHALPPYTGETGDLNP